MTISPGPECNGWWYGCEVDGPCTKELGAIAQSQTLLDLPGDHLPNNSLTVAAVADMGLSRMANPTAEVGTDLADGRGLGTLAAGRRKALRWSTAKSIRAVLLDLLSCFVGRLRPS